MNTKQLTAFAEGMMRETSTQTGEWVTVSRIALDEMSRESLDAIAALEAAERELDELRTLAEDQSKLAGINAARAQKAEAELARRDAEVSEPVGFIHPCTPFTFGKSSGAIFKEETRNYNMPVYTAASPAVLPPDVAEAVTRLEKFGFRRWVTAYKNPEEPEGYVAGNIRVSDLVKLFNFAKSAQQQKVVELPETHWTFDDDKNPVLDADEVIAALDAAGVKWEVKK